MTREQISRCKMYGAVATALLVLLTSTGAALSQQEVTAAPPDPEDERIDKYGISVPISATHPGRRFPSAEGFPTGPAIGERLPDFELSDQRGRTIEFHALELPLAELTLPTR